MILHNKFALNKFRISELLITLPWIIIFTTFSVVMQPDIVQLNVKIGYELSQVLFLFANLFFVIFLFSKYDLKYLAKLDILILGVFFIQCALVLKNYAFSGLLRNSFLIYSFVFYFVGRSAHINSLFSIKYFLNGIIIGAVLHVIASILLKLAFLSGNENLILVGANISGFRWNGYFINRATGFFSSPLTLSGFLLVALMLLTYFILERRRYYATYIFVLVGFLLTMSRGSFIAFIIFNFLIFILKPRLLYRKIVFALVGFGSLVIVFAVSSGILSFDRIFAKADFAVSFGTRSKNHSDHLVQWASNPFSLLFGDTSNQLGIDSDFLNYIFNLGLIVSIFYVLLMGYLVCFRRKNAFGIYLSAGLAAKILDSMLSGSSLGPPTSFAVMYLLGFWIGISNNKSIWG